VTTARLLLATGLFISATLVAAVGSWWGWGIGALQGAIGVAVVCWPRSPRPVAAAVLALVPPVLAAVRHWTARLPGACACARLPHPPPALVSVTGLVVAIDGLLVGLTLWLLATTRGAEVGKSRP
jgi:hypothetical protein